MWAKQIPINEVARALFSLGPAIIRDEDGSLTGYVYLDLATRNYGGYKDRADRLLKEKVALPAGYTWHWAGATGKLASGADLERATIDGAVQRLRPKLMTVTAVILNVAPILWESGIGSDVMKPIAAPIIGGMINSTIHVLILVPVFSFC